MTVATKSLHDLTAADLMSRELVVLSEDMTVRAAAASLLEHRVSGAPVVDAGGHCVGVISTADFVRFAARRDATGSGVNPFPGDTRFAGGDPFAYHEPFEVLTEWQVVEVEHLPREEVRWYMSPDPVTAEPGTPLRALARMMVEAHVHRLVVVDADRKPVGIVSSTDLLTALAHDEPHTVGPECDDGGSL